MTTHNLYHGDLPPNLTFVKSVAIDTETMGLNIQRDRLCLIQLADSDGNARLIQFAHGAKFSAPNLMKILLDHSIQKIFHFARFDLAVIKHSLGVMPHNIYCTRTASKFIRTYTDNHSLRGLCEELLGLDISKKQQSSYWGNATLNEKQIEYAANDVQHLHKLKSILDERLAREGRLALAMKAMEFLPTRAELDLAGWPEDIFAHNN